jgi:cation transport ATPase
MIVRSGTDRLRSFARAGRLRIHRLAASGIVNGVVPRLVEHRSRILAAFALVAIAAGGLLRLVGAGDAGSGVWAAAVAVLAAELLVEVVHTLVIDRHMGVDAIALVAMIGSLALGQELAGVIVGLMFTGGSALEDVASSRARRELTALIERTS